MCYDDTLWATIPKLNFKTTNRIWYSLIYYQFRSDLWINFKTDTVIIHSLAAAFRPRSMNSTDGPNMNIKMKNKMKLIFIAWISCVCSVHDDERAFENRLLIILCDFSLMVLFNCCEHTVQRNATKTRNESKEFLH